MDYNSLSKEEVWNLLLENEKKLKSLEKEMRSLIDGNEKNKLFIQRVVDTVPAIVYVSDINTHKNIYVNRSIFRSLGYDRNFIEDTPGFFFSILHIEDITKIKQHIASYSHLADGVSITIEYRLKNNAGKYIWFREIDTIFSRDPDGKPKEILGNIQDISEYKYAEKLKEANKTILLRNRLIEEQKEELQHTIKRLQNTRDKLIQTEKMASLGQLIAGIAHEINNPIGAILASNQLSENCLEKIQNIFPDLLPVIYSLSEQELRKVNELIEDGYKSNEHFSGSIYRKRKKELTEELNSMGLENAFIIADTMVDFGISEAIKKYPEVFLHPQASTLIDFILLQINLKRNTRTIQIAVDRASKILYALKNFSRFETSTEKKLVQLHENIETVLTLYYNYIKKGIEVIKDYEELPMLYCFPDDLLQVWTNLVHNAIQAMKFKGCIHIRIHREAEYVIVGIKDNGPGIPENIQGKIFDPFFTTKEQGEGSGLGLGIVQRILEKHSGKIEFESNSNGTTFYVFLPAEFIQTEA
ncbi:MAG: PAS domain-containing protein [Leptospiraceae bacterium]|nr:PAS domain-containing protein [Leptospiraceae bacterium]